jgi:hypothetical protein
MVTGGVKSRKTRHYRKMKPKTKMQLYDPSYEIQQKELKLMNLVKPTSPIKIQNKKEMIMKDKAQQKGHTDFVHGIVARFGLYTSAKTIPASVLCEHKN